MPPDVQIKQFELSDQEGVLAFLRHAYSDDPRKSDPAFWKWHYLENPYTSLDDVPLWIVKDGDRVVGQAATILVELKVGDETRKGIWILDFILLPEYRGQKLGKRLLQLARETYPTMMALGYNDQSGNVLLSLGWVPMGAINRYQKLLFPGYGLKVIAALAPLRWLVNLCCSPFRPGLRQTRAGRDYTVREVTRFDESLIKCFQERGKFPPNGIALTFDDGWKDNYTNAFPVLRQLGIKATIYIIPSSIGQVFSGATAAGEQPHAHLSQDEILEMAQHGIEFGSHTMNHRLLNKLSEPEVKSEVEEAKREIEKLLQKPCLTFAYPAGFFSEPARRAVEQAGHIAAFSTTYGPTDRVDLFALNRTEVLRRDRFLFQFSRKLAPLKSALRE